MSQLLPPHAKLGGYEILELVGRGGMGEVYRANQLSMDRIVALKVLSPKLVKQDPSFAKRFIDEAQAAGRLNNANIVHVHDVAKAPVPAEADNSANLPEWYFFSMEFVAGESVKDVIKREQRVSDEQTGTIMTGMANALLYAEQQGIVHRDIKPDNIMVTTTGEVKLADLGLALQLGTEEGLAEMEGAQKVVMGTPLYMSPEQARGNAVDHRSDQYSLGATLFHMLTGHPPYAGDSAKAIMKSHVFDPVPDPHDVRDSISEAWRQLCVRLMQKLPEERFSTGEELRVAVAGAINGVALDALVLRLARARAGKRSGLSPLLMAAIAALVLAGAGVAFLTLRPAVKKIEPTTNANPTAPDATAEARALSEAFNGLPTEPTLALKTLEALAQNPRWQSAAAQTAIAGETSKRRALLADAATRGQLALLKPAADLVSSGKLSAAKDAIAELANAHPELAGLEAFSALTKQLNDALAALAKGFTERLASSDAAAIDGILAEAKTAALSNDDLAAIAQAAIARRGVLAKSVENAANAAENTAWKELATALDQCRNSLDLLALDKVMVGFANRFTSPSGKAMYEALADFPTMVQTGQSLVRAAVEQSQPLIANARLNGQQTAIKLTRLGASDLSFRESVGSTFGTEKKLPRTQVWLPMGQLLDAVKDKRADDPHVAAACLWFWRASTTKAAIAKLGDDPLAKALSLLNQHVGGPDLAGFTSTQDGQTTVAYDFTAKDPGLISDFVGEGLGLGDAGLRWTPTKTITKGSFNENELPTVHWKSELKPPVTLRARILVPANTVRAMVGLNAGGRSWRIGVSNTPTMRVDAVVSAGDGAAFTSIRADNVVLALPGHALDLSMTVALDGSVSASAGAGANSAPLVFNPARPPPGLPAGAPVTVVLANYALEAGKPALELLSLTVTGAR